MGSSNGRESCGRCSVSTLVDAVESTHEGDRGDSPPGAADRDASSDASTRNDPADDSRPAPARDPFAGARIELDERDLRIANAPAILAGRLKRRLDAAAHRFVYE